MAQLEKASPLQGEVCHWNFLKQCNRSKALFSRGKKTTIHQVSHGKNKNLTFHYTGSLIEILIIAYYNSYRTGWYNHL